VIHQKTCIHVLIKNDRANFNLHKISLGSNDATSKIIFCEKLLPIDHYAQYLVLVHTADKSSRHYKYKYLSLNATQANKSDKLEIVNSVTERPFGISTDPQLFHVSDSYAAVTTCLTYYMQDANTIHAFISTLESQIVQFTMGHPVRVIKLDSIPRAIQVAQFGGKMIHQDTCIVIEHDTSASVYSLLDQAIVEQVKHVQSVLVNDFTNSGHDQVMFIQNDDLKFKLVTSPNEKKKESKGNHLYSVLRALQTRLEEGDAVLHQLEQVNHDKTELLKDMKRVLLEIIGTSNSDQEPLSRDHLVSSTPITINFTQKEQVLDAPVEKVPKSDVIQAKQSFNRDTWTIDMKLYAKSAPEVVPFASDRIVEATVHTKTQDDTMNIVTTSNTPSNYSDSKTHLHFMLVYRHDKNINFDFLGTVTPSIEQKIHGIRRMITYESPDVVSCELFLYRKSAQNGSLFELVCDLLLQTLQESSSSDMERVFEFNSTKQGFDTLSYCRIVIEKIQSEQYLRCTIHADTQESVLLYVQLLISELSEKSMIVPSVIADSVLDSLFQLASGLMEEVKFINQEKQGKIEKRKRLLELLSSTDLAFGNVLCTPCEDMKLWVHL
jgi:hypothetical protein